MRLRQWAVAIKDDSGGRRDSVLMYDIAAGNWKSVRLAHAQQRCIKAIQYSPTGNTLAVGCSTGLLLWRFGDASDAEESRGGWCYPRPHAAVHGLEFSPCGRFLATWSDASSRVQIWSTLYGSEPPANLSVSSTVRTVKWGSDDRVLVVTAGQSFTVYDASDWTPRSFSTRAARLRSGACGPHGEVALVASASRIWYTPLHQTFDKAHLIGYEPRLVADLRDQAGGRAGAPPRLQVSYIEWSPCRQRLAIAFTPDPAERRSHLVCVMAYDTKTHNLAPIGFIQGPAGHARAHPTHMKFRPHFKLGALLAICWSCDIITQNHFSFKMDASERSAKSLI